jgi:hypothetical protein
MSAEEALAYGLIDEIVQPNDEKLRQLALPPPGQSKELFKEVPQDAENYEFGKLVSACPTITMLVLVFSYVGCVAGRGRVVRVRVR